MRSKMQDWLDFPELFRDVADLATTTVEETVEGGDEDSSEHEDDIEDDDAESMPAYGVDNNICGINGCSLPRAHHGLCQPILLPRVESSAVVIGEFGGTQCPRGGLGATRPSAEPVTDRKPVAGSGGAGQRGGGSAEVAIARERVSRTDWAVEPGGR